VEVICTLATDVRLLAHTPDEIRAELARALQVRRAMVDAGDSDEVRRIDAHTTAYRWLLGDTDIAPVTGRQVPAGTRRDLALEQAPGRDHAEQNTRPYNDPERTYLEGVFDAIAWARGQLLDPPSGY
jgi:hypothetical protein